MINRIINSIENFQDRNAFYIHGEFYTYGKLGKAVSSIGAAIFSNYTTKTSKHIGVLIYDDIESYASCVATLLSGFGYVPINPMQPIERTIEMLNQANVEIILCSKTEDIQKIQEKLPEIEAIDTTQLSEAEFDFRKLSIDESSPAYVIFTSGSTGIPKGTPISRKNLNTFLDSVDALNWSISEKDGFLNMSSMTFDMSIITFIIPLCVGGCIYTVPEDEIKYLYGYKLMVEQDITFIAVVPSTLSYLKPYFSSINLPNIRYSLVCGEAFPMELAKDWQHCISNGEIINIYGPTEATVFTHTYSYEQDKHEECYNGVMALGQIVKNMKYVVLNEQDLEVDQGEKGELCISGMQLTSGYINNEEKNKLSFFTRELNGENQRFYRTGDIVFVDENGCFFYTGRKDHQVKIQGHRVELGEIEKHARDFTKNENTIAIAVKNDFGNYHIHLFTEQENILKEEIMAYLKTKIPYYMIPSGFSYLKKFPVNNNGKIDRIKLSKLI